MYLEKHDYSRIYEWWLRMLNKTKVYLHDIIYFYITFSVFSRILLTTEFIGNLPAISDLIGTCALMLRLILVVCEVVLILSRKLPLSHFFGVFVLAVLTILHYLTIEQWMLFDIFFVVICFNTLIDYEKVYDIVYKITLYMVVTIMILSSIGVIPSSSYYRVGDVTRYTFGFNHPNALGGHILFLVIFHFLRKDKTQYRDIFFVLGCAVFTYVFPNSVTASMCMFIMGVFMLIMKFDVFIAVARKKKIAFWISSVALVLIICLVYLIATRRLAEDFLVAISGTFYTRFIYGQRALQNYGFSIFGQHIKMVSERMLASGTMNQGYFNLDCVYFYMPIVMGVVPTIYYLYWYIRSMRNCAIARNVRLLGVLLLVALYAMSETTVLSYSMYFFLGALGYKNEKNKAISKKSNL